MSGNLEDKLVLIVERRWGPFEYLVSVENVTLSDKRRTNQDAILRGDDPWAAPNLHILSY